MAVQLVAYSFDLDIKRIVFLDFKSNGSEESNCVFHFIEEAEHEEIERAI